MIVKTLFLIGLTTLPNHSNVFPTSQLDDATATLHTAGASFIPYQLPKALSKTGQALQFHFLVNGLAVASEILDFANADPQPFVPLLPKKPLVLRNLLLLEAQGSTMEVLLEANHFESLTAPADLPTPQSLQDQSGSSPPAMASELFLLEKGFGFVVPRGLDQACFDLCRDRYASCAMFHCSNPNIFCDPCLDTYSECSNECF